MYKLARWLYALGGRNERDKFKAEIFYYLGWQPQKRESDDGLIESDEHFSKRIDTWLAARTLINDILVQIEEDRNKK